MSKKFTDSVGVTVPVWSQQTPQALPKDTTEQARKPEKYLRLPDVESLSALKKSSIYAGMRAGTFPPCVRLSVRAVAWRESDIAAWQAQRQQTGGNHD